MVQHIKLAVSYHCHPIWDLDDAGDFSPDELPIDNQLKRDLHSWCDLWNSTYNDEYPPDGGFATNDEKTAFDREGHRLFAELKRQLGSAYKVSYHSNLSSEIFE